jgi:hypothetical protein
MLKGLLIGAAVAAAAGGTVYGVYRFKHRRARGQNGTQGADVPAAQRSPTHHPQELPQASPAAGNGAGSILNVASKAVAVTQDIGRMMGQANQFAGEVTGVLDALHFG